MSLVSKDRRKKVKEKQRDVGKGAKGGKTKTNKPVFGFLKDVVKIITSKGKLDGLKEKKTLDKSKADILIENLNDSIFQFKDEQKAKREDTGSSIPFYRFFFDKGEHTCKINKTEELVSANPCVHKEQCFNFNVNQLPGERKLIRKRIRKLKHFWKNESVFYPFVYQKEYSFNLFSIIENDLSRKLVDFINK